MVLAIAVGSELTGDADVDRGYGCAVVVWNVGVWKRCAVGVR